MLILEQQIAMLELQQIILAWQNGTPERSQKCLCVQF